MDYFVYDYDGTKFIKVGLPLPAKLNYESDNILNPMDEESIDVVVDNLNANLVDDVSKLYLPGSFMMRKCECCGKYFMIHGWQIDFYLEDALSKCVECHIEETLDNMIISGIMVTREPLKDMVMRTPLKKVHLLSSGDIVVKAKPYDMSEYLKVGNLSGWGYFCDRNPLIR